MFLHHSDVLVIGGSSAGLSAAITAKRQHPNKSVTLLRKEKQTLVSCGIPYVFGTISSLGDIVIPNSLLEDNGIKLVVGDATKIDVSNFMVEVDGHDQIGYERLVIATGSRPAMLPAPGFERSGVFTISKEMSVLLELKQKLRNSRDLVVIGGGFIGAEVADECRKAGVKRITIVEDQAHCLGLWFDEEFAQKAEAILKNNGIAVKTGVNVTRMGGNAEVKEVVLEDGDVVPADAVIMCVGSVANTDLAKKAGLALGPTGAISVNRYMRTANERIFACGDCAEKVSFFGGRPSPIKLASISCSEGRIAGANLFGVRRENIGTIGALGTRIGGTSFACAGLTEQAAIATGYDCVTGVAEGPNRHPACMPGMEMIKVKLVFEKRNGVILGSQFMGSSSVGEMVNMMSACIQKKMTIDDIAAFQIGTHPCLTSSPLTYQTVDAAEMALQNALLHKEEE